MRARGPKLRLGWRGRLAESAEVRPVKVYAFDPSQGRTLGNHMVVRIPYERLSPGPVGRRIAVIDYDASNDCLYEPIDLEDSAMLLNGGLDPRESDPRFHQQMVYAVVSETMRHFEFALGREVHWNGEPQLPVYPHAMRDANAFYSPQLHALLFGYFPANHGDSGRNNPGQTVFTCLSHDIVAHETTHALVDGIRKYFTEPTNVDVPAFHEAFADVVALFRHFSYEEALLETVQRTGGDLQRFHLVAPRAPGADGPTIQAELDADNPLVGLAQQFGEAMGMRRALRSALGTPPNSNAITKLSEPHARGAILVAAIFDAFFTAYIRRSEDLFRIFRAGGRDVQRDLPHDLALRLCREASRTASHFFNICVRALDYCPPVDITFGDFLRAMITADMDIVPDDDLGYRDALMQAFRLRGIRAESAEYFSEDSLRWSAPDDKRKLPRLEMSGCLDEGGPTVGRIVESWADHPRVRRALRFDKGAVRMSSFHPLHRIGPDGQHAVNVVVELVQEKVQDVDPADPKLGKLVFRGGTTVLFEEDGTVRYCIHNRLSQDRIRAQQEHLARMRLAGFVGARYSACDRTHGSAGGARQVTLDLGAVHRGF